MPQAGLDADGIVAVALNALGRATKRRVAVRPLAVTASNPA